MLAEEGVASLPASGRKLLGERGGGSWSRDGRPRRDKHPKQNKLLGERTASRHPERSTSQPALRDRLALGPQTCIIRRMSNTPLHYRLYSQPHLYQLARAVGYDGKTDAEMRPIVKQLIEAHGSEKVSEALQELTIMERDNRTVLLLHVRKICTQLLGPAPEHPAHDEIRYAPILYSEEERRQWRQQFEAEKQPREAAAKAAQESDVPAEPGKKSRRKGRGR